MSANTWSGTTPSSRAVRKPSLIRAWRIEHTKGRTLWFTVAAVLVGLAGQALGATNYLQFKDTAFNTPELGWIALWCQGSVLVTTIFLPIVYVVTFAATASDEFEYRGWLHIMATDRFGVTIAGKVLYALELAIIGMGVYLIEAVITGFALGLTTQGLGPIVLRAGVAAVCAWSLGVTMMFIGVLFTTFPAMVLTGMAGTVLGLALTVTGTSLDRFLPFSMITIGMGARDMDAMSDPATIVPVAVTALVWVVVATLGTRWRLRRREW